MKAKIISISFLACAALIFQYCLNDLKFLLLPPCEKLKTTIERDITNSILKGTIKNDFNIHHIQLFFRSEDVSKCLKRYPLNLQTHTSGKIWLEIEIIDLYNNETPGFITQVSVFDLNTKNKISEFGQTYYMKDFIKNFKFPNILCEDSAK